MLRMRRQPFVFDEEYRDADHDEPYHSQPLHHVSSVIKGPSFPVDPKVPGVFSNDPTILVLDMVETPFISLCLAFLI
jgi:hypothetical protein